MGDTKVNSSGIIITPTGIQKGSATDHIEDRSAYLRSDANVSWDGSNFTFPDDIVLEIIDNISGATTTHTILTANSPISLADGESLWVKIDRTVSSENVTPHKTSVLAIPAQSDVNKDVFVIAKARSDGVNTYLHIPLHKQIIKTGDSLRLGSTSATVTFTAPTITKIVSGSGNYTPPAGALWFRIRMCGGGGGGANHTTNGTGGTSTTFGADLTANGGSAGTLDNGGAGGSFSLGSVTSAFGVHGGNGQGTGDNAVTTSSGGNGGANPFGGNGGGGSGASSSGSAGQTNTGAGGGGGGSSGTTGAAGGGGGAGGYIEAIYTSPFSGSPYAYSVGGGGAGNAAGGSGFIYIEEFYQ